MEYVFTLVLLFGDSSFYRMDTFESHQDCLDTRSKMAESSPYPVYKGERLTSIACVDDLKIKGVDI